MLRINEDFPFSRDLKIYRNDVNQNKKIPENSIKAIDEFNNIVKEKNKSLVLKRSKKIENFNI